jgi:hypothetical protein
MKRCRYPADRVPLHTNLKSRQRVGRAFTRRHVSSSTGPLPLCQGVLQCCHMSRGTGPLSPARKGSRAMTCIVSLDPISLLGRAPTPLRVLRLRTLLLYREGSDAITCHVVPCGPQASSIKKSLADLPMQLGSHVFKAQTQVSNAANVRVIMGLQDVQAGGVSNACKMCGHAATV